nr:MAG TPA_asm: intron associated endonuclease [Caudoviricetes sp.]
MNEIEKIYKLYVHISPSGKRYYGITCTKVEQRWGCDGQRYNRQPYFWNAIQKYGWDNFVHEVLFDDLTKHEACILEQCYIALYDTTNREKGYNCSIGGIEHSHTKETKEKIKKSISGENNGMYGKHHSDGAKEKMRQKKKDIYLGNKNPNAKKIRCIELNKVFDTVKDALEFINRTRSSLCDAMKRNGKCGGYHWEYVEEVN